MENQTEPNVIKPKHSHQPLIIVILIILALFSTITAIYLYWQNQHLSKQLIALTELKNSNLSKPTYNNLTSTPTQNYPTSNPSNYPSTNSDKQTEKIEASTSTKYFTAGGKYGNGLKYQISILPGWKIEHEWSDELAYDDIIISNDNIDAYKVKISQGDRSSAECIYSNTPEEGNDPYHYHSYVDLTDSDNNKYRREDYFKESTDSFANANQVCQYKPEGKEYSTTTQFGSMWFIFPLDELGKPVKNLDKNLITQIDTMIESIKLVR